MNRDKRKQLIDTTLNLFKRDLKIRYAGSILGPVWILIYPLLLTLITSLIFSIIFKEDIGNTPYLLFAMLGFVVWVYFSQSVSHSTRSLIYNRELIINARFPRESIILSISFSRLIDFAVNVGAFFLFFYLLKQEITLGRLLLLPIVIGLQTFFQLGVSFLTSSFNVYYRDIQNVVDITLQILFYFTPVLYPLSIVPASVKFIILLNPMTRILILYRDLLLNQEINLLNFVVSSVVSVTIFFVGFTVFKKLEPKFSELI